MIFGLTDDALCAIRGVLMKHPAAREAVVFGSRALGRFDERSDLDLAISGDVDPLEAERIALELEELPLAIRFDVQALDSIRHPDLREHIARVGKVLFRRAEPVQT